MPAMPRSRSGDAVATMLIDELRHRRQDIERLRHQFGASRIRVFGSVARREERSHSDIDLLVDFPRGYDLFGQRIALAEHLAELLNHPVDLVPEHELNPHIRARVLQEAVDL